MARPKPATPRPLLVRPGARFRCFGDGLCCTDIHALGPVTRSEARDLRARRKLSVVFNDDIDGDCLAPDGNGRCVYLGKQGCEIHRLEGSAAKPTGCRRFPYGLVATPLGGRITTEHRCPCRTLGDRPPLSVADAEASLSNHGGRLEVDRVAPDRIELIDGQRVPFALYAEIEAELLARLLRGEKAETVLGAKPLPALVDKGWAVIAAEIFDSRDPSAGGEALAWFGDALLELAVGHKPPPRPRPWAASFARATARTNPPENVEAIWNDWLADEIWMFRWLPWGPFDVARAELATRLAVARRMQARIRKLGVRADQAAAEAVMICELIAEGSDWGSAVAAFATDPSPAQSLYEAPKQAKVRKRRRTRK